MTGTPAIRPVLELDRVGRTIGGRAVLSEVSLALTPGRLTVVVGPNGAGKTTLLRIASGETAPDHGGVGWEGEPIAGRPAWWLAARRAVMTQSSEIGFSFPVAELVGLGFDAVGRRRARADRLAAIEAALEAADVAALAGRDVRTLSGGERQRVHFARALAQLEAGRAECERRALFLDEPVASLDLAHQIGLMEAARRIADGGVAVLAILHDLNLAATFADEIVALHDGRLAARGSPAAVVTEALIERVFAVAPRPPGRRPAEGVPVVAPQFFAVRRPGSPDRRSSPWPAS